MFGVRLAVSPVVVRKYYKTVFIQITGETVVS